MREHTLTEMGFKFGRSGPHSARTMMLGEATLLFGHVSPDAPKSEYRKAVVDQNVLLKPTSKARELAFRHLAELYGLDPSILVFRAFRRLWDIDQSGRPLLALTLALARDPLLRESWDFVTHKKPGEAVTREEVEALLEKQSPERFSAASLKSFAQNINGTWTEAGYLAGKVKKVRSIPNATPPDFAFAAFLAHLEGFRGQRLMQSRWIRLLDRTPDRIMEFAVAASRRGLLVFMHAGGVTEVRFPDQLTPAEEALLHE